MTHLRFYLLFAAAGLIVFAGWCIAYSAGLLATSDPWATRMGLLTAGLVAVGGLLILHHEHAEREHRRFAVHIERLCQVDADALSRDHSPDATRRLAPKNRWYATATRLDATVRATIDRVAELEDARRTLVIRCRRAAARHEQIRAILSQLDEPILVIDDYDEVVLANRAAEDLFRFDANTLENQVLEELVQCRALVTLLTTTSHRQASNGRVDDIEVTDHDGASRWYRVTANKLYGGEDGTLSQDAPRDVSEGDTNTGLRREGTSSAGAVAVLRDIANQKALQKQNAAFVSAVSHEMKTPLAGITAYVELLLDGDADDDETREEFLQVISSQADRLKRLVDNMLNLARIEAGVVTVSKTSRSLNELLEEAIHVVQPAAEAKRIHLTTELSSMYLGVLADRDMLLQAAINLLSNAVKYTGEQGHVTLRSRLEDNRVRFEVEDTGVGLTEEDCERVFEKFYRVRKDKAMAAGTGLGLPLAKHIVEDVHDGVLSVTSTPGEGSVFVVTLPAADQLA